MDPPRPSKVEIERHLDGLALWMDDRFEVPLLRWRFGMNALIDLVPGVGDAVTSLVALYILAAAVRYRVSKGTLLRMALTIGVYFVVGLLPVLGDLFGAWWKPNRRNLTLLRARATASPRDARRGRASDWLFVLGVAGVLVGLVAVAAWGAVHLLDAAVDALAPTPVPH